ncbi:MAG: calcium-binding protein, partial [Pseudomonadota bacterium]
VIDPINLFANSPGFEFFENPLQKSFEVFEILSADGFVVSDVSSTGFTVTLGNRAVQVTGTGFDAAADGSDVGTSGTIDTLVLVEGGQATHSVSDLALDIAAFNDLVALEDAGQADALETSVFSQNLTVIGHDSKDSGQFGTAASADGIFLQPRGDDLIMLGRGDDNFNAGAGNDTLLGQGGDDNIEGLTGRDRLQGGNGNDNLRGGDQRDLLLGGRGDDILDGGAGVDVMRGGDGNDTLNGGKGRDIMEGGADADSFQFFDAGFNAGFGNADVIRDFDTAEDQLFFGLTFTNDLSLFLGETGEVVADYGNGTVLLQGVTDIDAVTVVFADPDELT